MTHGVRGLADRDRMTRWRVTAAQVVGLVTCMLVIGVQVGQHSWLTEVDGAVTAWLVGHRTPIADHLALATTSAAGPSETLGVGILIAVAAAVRFGSYLSGLVVIVTVGGASALCATLKLLMGRGRPPIGIQETLETDYSFPSGHVTGTASLFGIAAVVIGVNRSRTIQRFLVGIAVVVVAAVGLSRLYLGVHWLTDVLAGILLAAAAVAIGASALTELGVTVRSADLPRYG